MSLLRECFSLQKVCENENGCVYSKKTCNCDGGILYFFCHGGIPETSEEFPKLLPVTLITILFQT